MDTVNRLTRYFVIHTVFFLTSWLPDITPVLIFRGMLVRPFIKKCGKNLQIARNVVINFPNRLHIGDDVILGYGAWIHAGGQITIGSETLVGPYAVIIAGNHSYENGSYRFGGGRHDRMPIELGKGCWIGAHATVIRGVKIGEGAMLAANSVANHDVPPYAIAGGVPAKILRILDN